MKKLILLGILLCQGLFASNQVLAADAPATFKVGEFTFKRPEAWGWVEVTSAMRKAQLKVQGAEGKLPAEVVFFHFGQGGGSVADNVDRWYRQFQGPRDKINARSEEKTLGGKKVTFVRAEGTFLSGMPGGPQTPQPEFALLGAIVASAEGNVFIKMTGPAALVKASEVQFEKMLEGASK